jgi:uncharacterized protein
VKIVDTNVLLYAVAEHERNHPAAKAWLDLALVGDEPVGFGWLAILGFLRLTTNRALASQPLSVDQAAGVVAGWLGQPAALVVHPTPRHLDLVTGLLASVGVGGNLVNDAHLAALALEHGAEVVSFDHDFGRFPGLAWLRPSAARSKGP